MWRAAIAPKRVPGYSKTRLHSVAEIQIMLAENFNQLQPFVAHLEARGIGDATRKKLQEVLVDRTKCASLKLELAAMRDMQVILCLPLDVSAWLQYHILPS